MLPGPVSILHSLRCPDMHNKRYMMAEVQALGTGRKIRIDISTVFNYNLTENKTQCTAITGEKPCGFKIGGKNRDGYRLVFIRYRYITDTFKTIPVPKRCRKAHKTTLPFM